MGKTELEETLIPGTEDSVVHAYSTFALRAKDAVFGLDEEEIVILDTETTGFNSEKEEIIEIAAAILKGSSILTRYSTFVNPGKSIPPEIVKLTGITDAMVANAPSIDMAIKEFAEFVGARDMVAHNASFDRAFIMKSARQGDFPGEWRDSLELARIALPRLRAHNLETLSTVFDTASSSHRAIDDVEALCGVWRVLLVALSDFPPGLLDFLAQLRPQTPWPLRPVIAQVAGVMSSEKFSLRMCRIKNVLNDKQKNKDDADTCVGDFPTKREVSLGFAQDSYVGTMYPTYEVREEQVAMAEEVIEAFSTSTFRAIEAGTGVGKSIAYLLPAALTAKKLNIGVGVATKTNALMDQLVYHELPQLRKALDGDLRYVALKGYEHYPCLYKLERFAVEEPSLVTPADVQSAQEALSMLATLYAFVAQTSWGDLDSINLYWRNLPKKHIAASSGECLHRHCPYYPNECMLHGLRQRAKSADIVVTNHALLFRDVVADGGILPPIKHWIIDEAHSAEDEARKQLSPSIGASDFFAALASLYLSHSSILFNVRRIAKKMDGGDIIIAASVKAEEQARSVETIATSFFSFVKDLGDTVEQNGYEYLDIWINDQVRDGGKWGPVGATGKSLADRLKKLIAMCKEIAALFEASSGEVADIRSEISGAMCYLQEMYDALVLCINGDNEEYVYAANVCRNPDKPFEELNSLLLDVGQELVGSFYPRVWSVVYTSATIAAGTSFAHFERATGLDRLDQGSYKSLQLSSSYDYDNNMKIFVPKDMPAPNEPGYLNALEQMLRGVHFAMGGSTLTLFTNRREMEQLYFILQPEFARAGIKLICQLRGFSAKRVRDEFLSDEKICLFALRSFWEGFDAPGDTLRCVIIPRLPFSRPNDPLAKEREKRDKNAWNHYSLPEAAINLKQASGRLIRTSTDKGYLVLGDSRLVTKRYGKVFLEALPSKNQLFLETSQMCQVIETHRF